MNILLEPGDIFFTRSSSFVNRAIHFFTRSIGEKRTKVNHVGIVVQRGDIKTAIVVEAQSKVVRHKLWSRYGPPKKDLVAVYRATNLAAEQVRDIQEIWLLCDCRSFKRLAIFGNIFLQTIDSW